MNLKKILSNNIHYLFSVIVFLILASLFSQINLLCGGLWNQYKIIVSFLFAGWGLIVSISFGEVLKKNKIKNERIWYFISTIIIVVIYILTMLYFVRIMS